MGQDLTARERIGAMPEPAVHVTELAVDIGAGGVAVTKATEIRVGAATIVVLEWADGITSVGNSVRGYAGADPTRVSEAALRHALERGETLRLRWAQPRKVAAAP